MGKSIDLPDPLESTASQPLGNADDLLAQLAGEEVDRLLAEAEGTPRRGREARGEGSGAPSPADLAAAVTAPPPTPEHSIQHQLDALFGDLPGGPHAAADAEPQPGLDSPHESSSGQMAVAPIAPGPFSPVTSKLPDDIDADEVMAAIMGDAASTASAPTALPAPAVAPDSVPAARPASMEHVSVPPAQRGGGVSERAALLATTNPADELPGPGELALLTAPVEDDTPLPLYLKPLEWMNAPLDLLPARVRDVIGQVALLTLINAIAVLVYVFVFRKS